MSDADTERRRKKLLKEIAALLDGQSLTTIMRVHSSLQLLRFHGGLDKEGQGNVDR